MPKTDKKIYLTFDDGPIPEVTEFVLETLENYGAKATFFCIGDNIRKNPNIFQNIIKQGHSIGNHTYNHLKGWDTDNDLYLENTAKCAEEMRFHGQETELFRPPYGRIKQAQAHALLPAYKIIMWDVLSGDFAENLSSETVLKKSIQYTTSGSIVVFHDSQKAYLRMAYTLPRLLDFFSEKGYEFVKI